MLLCLTAPCCFAWHQAAFAVEKPDWRCASINSEGSACVLRGVSCTLDCVTDQACLLPRLNQISHVSIKSSICHLLDCVTAFNHVSSHCSQTKFACAWVAARKVHFQQRGHTAPETRTSVHGGLDKAHAHTQPHVMRTLLAARRSASQRGCTA